MDGMSMMIMQLIQNLGINPDELIKTITDFKNTAEQLAENQIRVAENQIRVEQKLDLLLNHLNITPLDNSNVTHHE